MNQFSMPPEIVRPDDHDTRSRGAKVAIAFLIGAGLINNLDRSALSVANHLVASELQLSAAQMGMMMSSFSIVYAFSQLPIGLILDRFGARIVFGLGLLFWSTAQLACGFVQTFQQMLLGRALLGVGESPHYPACAKIVSEWFPAEKRGGPTSLFLIAGTVAPALAPPLLTLLLIAVGWRMMFATLGVLGIVLALTWFAVYRNRTTDRQTSDMPAHDDQTCATRPGFAEWRALMFQRNTIAMMLGSAGVIYMIWLYVSWLPAYLEHEQNVSIAKTGWLAAIPYAAGTLGQLSCGTFIDFLTRKGYSVSLSRKIPTCIGLVVAAMFTAAAAAAHTPALAVAAISGALFSIYFANVGTWAIVGVMVPSRLVATMGSVLTFGGYLGGSAAPVITGVIVDRTHSFANGLLISACLAIVAAAVFAFGIRIKDQI
ncbi:MFS transporter [Burkholderia sp. Bp9099]|uniref:MFS transporter n=1 Tax=Burkholderia sp. Bp9099 TaxID=2184568 RepID=UPI002892DFAE|nr:MFS transporter [Burkholderia sp. Bp9099]